MRVLYVPHGHYRLVLGQNVLLCVMFQSFNGEAADRLFAEVKEVLSTSPRRATLVDNRLWELMTPEAADILAELNQWTIENGVHYNAHLNTSLASRAIVDANLAPDSESYQRRQFNEPLEAVAWLRENGCDVSDEELSALYAEHE